MDDEGFGIAHVCKVADQFYIIHQVVRSRFATLVRAAARTAAEMRESAESLERVALTLQRMAFSGRL